MGLPEKLKYARERAGLTGAQVKARTGLGESSVSEFENGKREPSLSQLHALAKAYLRSVAFFLAEGPIHQEMVLWRARPLQGAGEIEARFLRLCEKYHNLEVWCGEGALAHLPAAEGEPGTFDYAAAEELAKRVRRDLELGHRPGQTLLRVLEEICTVKVFHLSLDPTGTAASTLSETFGPAVLLNARNTRWRRNFDLAHELFHLLTWGIFRPSGGDVPGQREESLADCFASNLLLPSEAAETALRARTHGGRISYEALFDVAREFDVSVEALLWKLHFLRRGPGDAEQTRKEIDRARELAPILEQRETDTPPVLPARYHALAVKAVRHGEISIGRFAEYLDISRQKAMRYVEQEAPDGDEVQVAPA